MGIAQRCERAEDIPGVLRRIAALPRRLPPKSRLVVLLVVLTSGLSLLTPYLTGLAIDDGIIPGDIDRLLRIVAV
jgi:ATP-binding cassette subfamily B multidrug efflux pump